MNKISGAIPISSKKIFINSSVSNIPKVTDTIVNNAINNIVEEYDFNVDNKSCAIEVYDLEYNESNSTISDMFNVVDGIIQKRDISVLYSDINSLLEGLNKVYVEFITYDSSTNYIYRENILII